MTKLFALMMVVAACGDDSMMMMAQPDAGDPPQQDAPAVPRVTIGGKAYDLDLSKPVNTTDQAPLQGAEVCSIVPGEAKTCVTTDAQGYFALSMPKQRTGVGFTMSKAGYVSVYSMHATIDTDEPNLFTRWVARESDVAAFAAASGMTYPLSTTTVGLLIGGFRYTAPNYAYLDGATLSATAGNGPLYYSGPWQYGAGQTTTTTAGMGYTAFGDVPVTSGTVDVTITLAGTTCSAWRQMVPLVTDDTIRVPVIPGFFTHVPVNCE